MLLPEELLQNKTGASFVCLHWLRGGNTGNPFWIINEPAAALTDYYSHYSNRVAPELLLVQWSAPNLRDFVNSGDRLGVGVAGGARECSKQTQRRETAFAGVRRFAGGACVSPKGRLGRMDAAVANGYLPCSRHFFFFLLEAQQSNLSIHWWAALVVSLRDTWNRSFLSPSDRSLEQNGLKRKYKRRGGGICRWSHFRC